MPSKIFLWYSPLDPYVWLWYASLIINKGDSQNKNKTWADILPKEVYNRLANCRTIKADLPILLAAKWSWTRGKAGYTKEDCLVDILDLLGCNGLEAVTDLTIEEWESLAR